MPNAIDTQGKTLSEIRAEAGRRGGLATLEKHGDDHFVHLARRMHRMYERIPFGQNDFAIVHRKTGKVVAMLSGKPVPEFLQKPAHEIEGA